MEQVHLTYYEAILVAVLVGIVIGILLGLIPLILGIRKKKTRLGVYGFVGAIIGGAISSILSILIVGVFTWLILKKPVAETDFNASDSEVADSKNSDSSESVNS